MEYLPFQELIDITREFSILIRNKQRFDIEYEFTKKIETKISTLNVNAEINKLRSELLKIDNSRQFLYVKLILNDLISSYSTINSVDRIEEEDKYCKSSLTITFYEAIGDIIKLLKDMNISITKDFIQSCEERKEINPIGMIINTLKEHDLIYAKSTSSQSNNTQQIGEPFTTEITQIQRDNLFDKLKANKFISNDTDKNSFMYVFGVNESPEIFKPIKWLEKVGVLAYFINQYTEDNNIWKKTECFFVLINGDRPKINSMKNTISKIKTDSKNKPKNSHLIDKILKE